ncbi:hypothetical protein [Bacillus rhizoplanae]|uniref:hypothetical protein n=1 Tax=Bacillus rhizoplanae TaxID=2880966 RepID=UPI003D1BA206
MGIWKIDGIRKDYKGRKNEEEFNINLIIRNGNWGVQLDVEITPLFCMNCNKQLDGFFKHDGSRYGQVGTVICNNCGAKIDCIDHDNIVENLKTYTDRKEYIIDYYKLYKLEKEIWKVIKEKIGYDIFERHKDKKTTLQDVIKEICEEYCIELRDIPIDIPQTDDRINVLPNIVNNWLMLIKHLNIIV